MATLNTRTAHLVAKVTVEREVPNDPEHDETPFTTFREIWALRSDGKILRRIVWTDDHGTPRWYTDKPGVKTSRLESNNAYTIFGTLKPEVERTRETLDRVVISRLKGNARVVA